MGQICVLVKSHIHRNAVSLVTLTCMEHQVLCYKGDAQILEVRLFTRYLEL